MKKSKVRFLTNDKIISLINKIPGLGNLTPLGIFTSILISFLANILVTKLFSPKGVSDRKKDIKRTFRSANAPRELVYGTVQKSGALLYVSSSGEDNKYLHFVIQLAGTEVQRIGDVWIGERLSTDKKIRDFVRVEKYLGKKDQEASQTLIRESKEWTIDHRLSGIAYIYVRLTWDEDVWLSGIPNIKAMVYGRKIYDPRRKKETFTNNWALCIRDYLLHPYGLGVKPEELDEDSFLAAANICDRVVDIGRNKKGRQFTCDGVIHLDQSPAAIIEDMLTAAAGNLVYSNGKYHLYPASYQIPTQTITDDDIIDEVVVQPTPSRKDLFNAVRGSFISPDTDWELSDFPILKNEYYRNQDGEYIEHDVELNFTTNSYRAQRLAKIILEKSRVATKLKLKCKLKALHFSPMENVFLSIKPLSIEKKVFKILDWNLDTAGHISLELQRDVPEIYTFNKNDFIEHTLAPLTNLPDPANIDPPIIVKVESGTEHILVGSSGAVINQIYIEWIRPFQFTISQIEIQYRSSNQSNYSKSQIINGQLLNYYLTGLNDKTFYSIRLRAINFYGAKSHWAYTSHYLRGKTQPPERVKGFSIFTQETGKSTLSWLPNTETDLAGYKIRCKKERWNSETETVFRLSDEKPEPPLSDKEFNNIFQATGVFIQQVSASIEARDYSPPVEEWVLTLSPHARPTEPKNFRNNTREKLEKVKFLILAPDQQLWDWLIEHEGDTIREITLSGFRGSNKWIKYDWTLPVESGVVKRFDDGFGWRSKGFSNKETSTRVIAIALVFKATNIPVGGKIDELDNVHPEKIYNLPFKNNLKEIKSGQLDETNESRTKDLWLLFVRDKNNYTSESAFNTNLATNEKFVIDQFNLNYLTDDYGWPVKFGINLNIKFTMEVNKSSDFHENNFIPDGWAIKPPAIINNSDIIWVMVRERVSISEWGDFSEVKLWNERSGDGFVDLHEGLLSNSFLEVDLVESGKYLFGIWAVDTSGNYSQPTFIVTDLITNQLKDSLYYKNIKGLDFKKYLEPNFVQPLLYDNAFGVLRLEPIKWADFNKWETFNRWIKPTKLNFHYNTAVVDFGQDITFYPVIKGEGEFGKLNIIIAFKPESDVWYRYPVNYLIKARYFALQLEISKDGLDANIPFMHLSQLSINLITKTSEEYINDADTSTWAGSLAGGRIIPLEKEYDTITLIQVALQNVGANWSWEIVDKDSKSPKIKIYNAAGAAKDATVDIFIKGVKV